MPQRKVLMLASVAERGPWVPLDKYELEIEPGHDAVEVYIEFYEDKLGIGRIHRIGGSLPLTVYANCDD